VLGYVVWGTQGALVFACTTEILLAPLKVIEINDASSRQLLCYGTQTWSQPQVWLSIPFPDACSLFSTLHASTFAPAAAVRTRVPQVRCVQSL